MKIHELTTSSTKSKKRVGRGIGSGYGKTSGRGTKGQNSRSGGGVRLGFEGGQNPLAKRLPKKRGFVPVNQTKYATINLNQLDKLKGGEINTVTLVDAGLIKHPRSPVKILGTGKVTKKFSIKLGAATASARAAIEKAGGTFEATASSHSPKKPSKRNRDA
jgi:large subunit ribosomal protein L15